MIAVEVEQQRLVKRCRLNVFLIVEVVKKWGWMHVITLSMWKSIWPISKKLCKFNGQMILMQTCIYYLLIIMSVITGQQNIQATLSDEIDCPKSISFSQCKNVLKKVST